MSSLVASQAIPTPSATEPLSRHQGLQLLVQQWLLSQWPEWYGPGGQGNVSQDVSSFASSESKLPVGFVFFEEQVPIGFGALKTESIPSHKHRSPWAAAGFVLPRHRGRGVGAALLKAMVAHAHSLGFAHVYCGTSTAVALLRRSGWSELEVTRHAGKALSIFRSVR